MPYLKRTHRHKQRAYAAYMYERTWNAVLTTGRAGEPIRPSEIAQKVRDAGTIFTREVIRSMVRRGMLEHVSTATIVREGHPEQTEPVYRFIEIEPS